MVSVTHKPDLIYVISDIDKAIEFEWALVDTYELYKTHLILIAKDSNSDLALFAKSQNISVDQFSYDSLFDLLVILFRLLHLLVKKKPRIIHCHLYKANILGLIAGLLAGVPHRVYTRHHSDFHHCYHKKGVLIDKLINKLSTTIVSISSVVTFILHKNEGVPLFKIVEINHGLDYSVFYPHSHSSNEIIAKYDLSVKWPIIGVISRFVHWKGIQYIIPAFERILQQYPNACLTLANATGDYCSEILNDLERLPEDSYRLIVFEKNLPALWSSFDLFIHVPISPTAEAFGQVYLEALAMGIPSVMTKSGIGNQILKDNYNCILVPFQDSDSIFAGMFKLLSDRDLYE
jgi:glycosyltransferase involved in cell wall biosynthesis